MREAGVKRHDALRVEVRDVVGGEGDRERLDVALELRDLARAHDGEDIRRLVHHIREGD